MTLTGQHNHYNVKFLKGYGFSVNVKDNKIVLKNAYDPFNKPEVEEWYVNNMPYEKIVKTVEQAIFQLLATIVHVRLGLCTVQHDLLETRLISCHYYIPHSLWICLTEVELGRLLILQYSKVALLYF